MFPIITSLTYLPFAWAGNNFIFLWNYKKRIIKYTEIPYFCPGHKTSLYWCTKVHSLVWFPTKPLIVMKTKFSYGLQNKPHYNICVKSCVCASFFLSFFFFFFQFSGLIQIVRLIALQPFSVGKKKKKNTSSVQKAVCVKNCFFLTPHLLTLGWLNFCRWSSLCW